MVSCFLTAGRESCLFVTLKLLKDPQKYLYSVCCSMRINRNSDHLFLLVLFDIKVFISSGKEYLI